MAGLQGARSSQEPSAIANDAAWVHQDVCLSLKHKNIELIGHMFGCSLVLG